MPVTVRLSPASINQYLSPSKCSRRVWLKANRPDLEEDRAGAFDEFIQKEGLKHEDRTLRALRTEHPDWIDIGGVENPDAFSGTLRSVKQGRELIYQGLLVHDKVAIAGQDVRVIGYPDFMIKTGPGYEIADAKLARAIYEEGKSGKRKLKRGRLKIELQLQLYGWLFRQQFPDLEVRLSVINGKGEREEIPDDGGKAALDQLRKILEIRGESGEPWEPVGWSKCVTCSFKTHCWDRAEAECETGLVPDLTQLLCRKLRKKNIESYPELLKRVDGRELASIKNESKGPDDRENLAGAERILENARALLDGSPRLRFGVLPISDSVKATLFNPSYVMFDLEGIPPDIDRDWDKVYLWGLQVFGEKQGDFLYSLAGFGEDGDKQGWEDFLVIARSLLDEHPGIRFVHWASYESDKIEAYMKRYPDTDLDTAREVLEQLLDLLDETKELVAVPAPSYSLKVIEEMPAVGSATGFSRTEHEDEKDGVSSGDQSIAAYMEALEAGDRPHRQALMQQIIDYNREDLEATWAVMRWLQDFISTEAERARRAGESPGSRTG